MPDRPLHALVVDDEALVAAVVAEVLRDRGFRVTVSHDASEALAMERADPADVLVTDLRMPGMDGNALVRRMRDLRPDLPIVVMTAYSEVMPLETAGQLSVLRKPFSLNKMLETVQTMLGSRPF